MNNEIHVNMQTNSTTTNEANNVVKVKKASKKYGRVCDSRIPLNGYGVAFAHMLTYVAKDETECTKQA